jgi:membrane-associated phospholipid phosphatase
VRLAAGVLLSVLLAALVVAVLSRQPIDDIDRALNAFLGPYRARPLLHAFVWVTGLGGGAAVVAAAMIASAFLWLERRRRVILALWLTWLGAEATSWTGKFLIGRVRPEFIDVAMASSPSFPSGHSAMSMAVYGFLAYAIARQLEGRAERRLVLWCAAFLILSIGFSRIFLSVHHASDVLGGFLIGAIWLLAGIAFAERTPAPERHQDTVR